MAVTSQDSEDAQQQAAAIKIQAKYRQKAAKQKVSKIKKQKEKEQPLSDEQKAAGKIQKVFRAHRYKRNVALIRLINGDVRRRLVRDPADKPGTFFRKICQLFASSAKMCLKVFKASQNADFKQVEEYWDFDAFWNDMVNSVAKYDLEPDHETDSPSGLNHQTPNPQGFNIDQIQIPQGLIDLAREHSYSEDDMRKGYLLMLSHMQAKGMLDMSVQLFGKYLQWMGEKSEFGKAHSQLAPVIRLSKFLLSCCQNLEFLYLISRNLEFQTVDAPLRVWLQSWCQKAKSESGGSVLGMDALQMIHELFYSYTLQENSASEVPSEFENGEQDEWWLKDDASPPQQNLTLMGVVKGRNKAQSLVKATRESMREQEELLAKEAARMREQEEFEGRLKATRELSTSGQDKLFEFTTVEQDILVDGTDHDQPPGGLIDLVRAYGFPEDDFRKGYWPLERRMKVQGALDDAELFTAHLKKIAEKSKSHRGSVLAAMHRLSKFLFSCGQEAFDAWHGRWVRRKNTRPTCKDFEPRTLASRDGIPAELLDVAVTYGFGKDDLRKGFCLLQKHMPSEGLLDDPERFADYLREIARKSESAHWYSKLAARNRLLYFFCKFLLICGEKGFHFLVSETETAKPITFMATSRVLMHAGVIKAVAGPSGKSASRKTCFDLDVLRSELALVDSHTVQSFLADHELGTLYHWMVAKLRKENAAHGKVLQQRAGVLGLNGKQLYRFIFEEESTLPDDELENLQHKVWQFAEQQKLNRSRQRNSKASLQRLNFAIHGSASNAARSLQRKMFGPLAAISPNELTPIAPAEARPLAANHARHRLPTKQGKLDRAAAYGVTRAIPELSELNAY